MLRIMGNNIDEYSYENDHEVMMILNCLMMVVDDDVDMNMIIVMI